MACYDDVSISNVITICNVITVNQLRSHVNTFRTLSHEANTTYKISIFHD